MSVGTMSRKEDLWLACKPKTCCYVATVIPTGRDVWRISRTLQAPPWTFLRYFESPEPRRDAFALDGSDRRFRLALAKQPSRRKKTPPPCIFLMRTNGGHHRCSLGDLRPASCRSFPSEVTQGGVLCLNPIGCTCHEWNLSDVDVAQERALVETRQQDGAEYAAIVARWNARVAAASDDARFDLPAYCAFLLGAYDALAAGAPLELPRE